MPRKLLLKLLACLAAVTAWGAGLPLVHAASTVRDESSSATFATSQFFAPATFHQSAPDLDTSYWAEKWLLAFRPSALGIAPAVAETNATADATAQEPEGTPPPAAAPQPAREPKPETKPNPQEPQSTPKPDPTPKPEPTPKPDPNPDPKPDYEGTTHLWYPSLGISASWRWYGCEYGGNTNGLGAGVYRWGCVGGKNVYLMSHAWSTFSAIRHGYHSGRMDVGQHVWYADSQGDVTEFRVKWIKHVDADYFNRTANEWASEYSSSTEMTLQTCDGSNSQYRIVVRLTPA